MFNGIRQAASSNQKILGVVVLRGWKEENEIDNAGLFLDYHFGGFTQIHNLTLTFRN
jgi:hypothetical protein